MFELLYKAGPNTRLTWREVLPGAATAAVLFEIAKLGFVFYVKQFMGTENVYGAIGGVIVLLTWCYFSGMILLLGAEVASEYTKLKRAEQKQQISPRPAPGNLVPHPRPVTQRLTAVGGAAVGLAVALAAVRRTRRSGAI